MQVKIFTMKFMIYGVFTFAYKYAGHKPCPLSRPHKYSGLHYIILRSSFSTKTTARRNPPVSLFEYCSQIRE